MSHNNLPWAINWQIGEVWMHNHLYTKNNADVLFINAKIKMQIAIIISYAACPRNLLMVWL